MYNSRTLILFFVAIVLSLEPAVAAGNCNVGDALRSMLSRIRGRNTASARAATAELPELNAGRSVAKIERDMRTSALSAVTDARLPGMNGARLAQLEDGTRVVVKPAVTRHGTANVEVRVGDYEISASIVDRQLDIGSVPPIVSRTIDGRAGTVQKFIEGATAGGSSRVNPDELAMFDYLIRNQDRSYTNYLSLGGRPVAIDNGFTFTNKTLTSFTPPDFPATVQTLVGEIRAGGRAGAAARERLERILPNENTFERLRDTNPDQWRRLLQARLQPDEIAGFLQRRQQVLDAISTARTAGGNVMRQGRTPVRFTPGAGEEVPDFLRSSVPPRTGT